MSPKVILATGVLLLAAFTPARNVAAVNYNDTNPVATPCGDGSHPVTPLRAFYIKSGGLAYARIELRYSPFCNTVWTKVVNLTGSGNGYAPAASITADEQIVTYDCPVTTQCFDQSQRENGDVLPGNGNAGWSHQLVLPPNGARGTPAAVQPPTIRGLATIRTSGNTYTFDTALEPMWTWYANAFKNERNLRNNATVMTCSNSPDRCVTQGQVGGSGGASATVMYELDPNLANSAGPADLVADIKNVLLPAWSQRLARSPKMLWCVAPCTEKVMIKLAPASDPDMGTRFAVTIPDGGFTAGTPAIYLHQTLKIRDTLVFDHSCGLVDDGCTGSNGDDRPLVSHEIGHSIGLGHCDLNYGVMCHVRPSLTSEITEGTMYWTPQKSEVLALQAFYP